MMMVFCFRLRNTLGFTRKILAQFGSLILVVLFTYGCAKQKHDAVVSSACEKTWQNCFSSLQSAVDAAEKQADVRSKSRRYFHIFIESGDYREKVRIDYPWLKIQGDGRQTTRLHHELVAANAGKYHRDNWGTAGSATLTINSHDIIVENLKIENDFDFISNDAKAKDDPKRVRKSQAVALLLDINSDRVLMKDVELLAYQDTLFANGKRAYIKNSRIAGNVDFIFGNGQLLIESSEIVSRKRGKSFKPGEIQGHVTAPSTSIKNKYGLVFVNSKLLREEGVANASHSLARPWHPTTNFPDGRYADPEAIGYAAFINCYMDAHIIPQAWATMNGTARDGSKSRVFTPAESRFYEYNSSGPGAMRENNEGKILEKVDLTALKEEMLGDWSIKEK